jgi:hypothetical protein
MHTIERIAAGSSLGSTELSNRSQGDSSPLVVRLEDHSEADTMNERRSIRDERERTKKSDPPGVIGNANSLGEQGTIGFQTWNRCSFYS